MNRFTPSDRVAAQTAYGLVNRATPPGFTIRQFTLRPGEWIEPHHHELPVLVALIEGSYEQEFGGRRVDCLPGHSVVVPGGERHSERVGNRGATCLLITPSSAMAGEISGAGGALESFERLDCPTLADLARRVQATFARGDALASLERQSLTLDFAISLARARAGGAAGETRFGPASWLDRAKDLLDDRFRESLSLRAVAREVGVSQGHLARSFRSAFGLSVGEYLRARRLEESERLLRTTMEPLTHVAFASGFCDQSHFGGAFRRRYGASPAQYRRMHRH